VRPADTATPIATVDPEGESIDVPNPSTPSDTAVIAVDDVGDQNGLNQAQSPESVHYWGIGETLFLRANDDSSTPWLATDYEVATDLSGATITIREGVMFSGGFGELTAADVAFSMNNANAATNPQSIHGQAGDFAGLWGEWTAVDDTTIEFTFTSFDATWKDDFLNQSGQGFAVFSKKAYDDNGEDYSRDNIVATGPYLVESWDRDDQVTLVSRYADGGEHYLPELTPMTDRIQFREALDPQVRATLLQTGEVDAALLEPKDAAAFIRGGFGQTGTQGSVQLGVFFAGNLWEKVSARDGSPLDRLTYNVDLPWIGDPDDADDMEQARLVRRALAVAIDREQANETLLSGLGKPVHVEYFNDSSPNWDSKWEYPYDPDEAIDILENQITNDYYTGQVSDGSLLNGNTFEISVYAGPELGGGQSVTGEVADAVAGFWAQIGLTTFSLKYSYQTFRPTVVGRTNTNPWITSCDKGRESNPWHFPKGLVQTSLTRGGFGCAFESPDILAFYNRMAQAADQAEATAAATEYLEYVYYWNLQPGVVAVPNDVFYNPNKIDEWVMPKSATSAIDGLWNLTLK
jgi:peptide/nickel transport system substrate-binding protein